MRLIDADALESELYHKAFETDTDMQKWDSGCWIRYKMFENAIRNAPTIKDDKTAELIVLKFNALMGCVEMNEDREQVLTQIERDGVVFLPYYMSVLYIGNKCEVKFVDEEEKEVDKR